MTFVRLTMLQRGVIARCRAVPGVGKALAEAVSRAWLHRRVYDVTPHLRVNPRVVPDELLHDITIANTHVTTTPED